MPQHYDETFKKKIVRLRIEEGRSMKSIIEEYGISKSSVILCKGNRLEAYRFIQGHHHEFGVRWLLRKLGICPNAYYNFLKDRKSAYRAKKQLVLREIATIYHEHSGTDVYRSMQVFLARKQIQLLVHHYMNRELNFHAIVQRKKQNYQKGTAHKVFDNLLNQDFQAEQTNQKWATAFTYIFLKDGSVRYNCSVIDLHDRSVVSSITGRNITSNLAIRTVKKALKVQTTVSRNLILHWHQGSQVTF